MLILRSGIDHFVSGVLRKLKLYFFILLRNFLRQFLRRIIQFLCSFDLRDSLRCASEISPANPRTPTTSCPAFFAFFAPELTNKNVWKCSV